MTAVSEHTPRVLTRPDRPLPFVAAPEQGLRTLRTPHNRWVWFVGAHGGCGESTLAELLPNAGAAEHRWPLPADGGVPAVVLVARTSYTGLLAARAALTQWAAGDTPPVQLLGLVLSADAPGRDPKPLRDLADVVAGGTRDRTVWRLPWVEAWRIGERADRKITARLFSDLGRLTDSKEEPCT
jgi:hypothetical protein